MPTNLRGRPVGSQMLGYSGLFEAYGLQCPLPRRMTAIASVSRKTTIVRDGVEWLLLPRGASYRIPDAPIEHLGAALKHEGLDLRVLHSLFNAGVEAELGRYIDSNRAGLYTRRAWFLYEWLTGRQLHVEEPYGVQYVEVLDSNLYIDLPTPPRSARHKVINNLPGVQDFCPLIRRTERLAPDRIAGLAAEAREVVSNADPAVLRRAVGFMLLKESKGSFGIEGETPPRNRLERWGRLIADAKSINLSVAELESLHRSLFDERGPQFVVYNLRRIGGFVGRHDSRDQTPIPDHISAKHIDLNRLLKGLIETFNTLKKHNFDPILTAAIIGFGFVFIHPFEDGNGRLHRFLIQKALVDMDFNPPGIVLPVSSAILEDLVGYRSVLEDFSASALPYIEWEPTADGNVQVTNNTRHLYQYFDATRQAEYILDRLERTIKFSLPSELQYLHSFDEAKRRLSSLIDLPDRLMSLFIQFCVQNEGHLSRRKRQDHFSQLDDEMLSIMEATIKSSGILDLSHSSR